MATNKPIPTKPGSLQHQPTKVHGGVVAPSLVKPPPPPPKSNGQGNNGAK